MLISIAIILVTVFVSTKTSKLPSFIPVLLCIFPLIQSFVIAYTFYFREELFLENFIHADFLDEKGVYFVLINYCIYVVLIYTISFVILKSLQFSPSSFKYLDFSNFSFSLDKLVILYSLISILFLTTTKLDGFIPKVIRITYYQMNFVSILVGYFFKKINFKVLFLFISVMAFFTGANLLLGSRGYLATILLSFTLGFIANQENKELRRVFFLTTGAIVILIFPILSFIEQFRVFYGRISFDEVDIDRIRLLISEYQSNYNTEGINDAGIARLINWPAISVILLTGVIVPTVGFSNIGNDLNFIFTNTFLTGKGIQDSREQYITNLWGSSPANLYDYNVTVSNSVEFSVMADGIWRYGQFGYFFNLVILLLFTLSIEYYIFKSISRRKVSLFKLFILGNVYLILFNMVGAEPLISILRSLIYTIVFSFIISRLFFLLLHRKTGIKN
jgi:hypothetical protein